MAKEKITEFKKPKTVEVPKAKNDDKKVPAEDRSLANYRASRGVK